jgi:hypothetical protein
MKNSRLYRRAGLLAAAVLTVSLLPALPARAQDAVVTLEVSRRHVTFQRAVTFSGTVSDPTAPGQIVDLVNADGVALTSAEVQSDGTFEVDFEPRKKTILTAAYGAASSSPVTVNVKPIVDVRMKAGALFGRARIVGTIRPVMAGERAIVSLLRDGRKVGTRSVRLGNSPRFTTSMKVRKPGYQIARVVVDGSEHLAERARTNGFSPALPSLSVGSRSRAVKLLERRLIALSYYLPGADRVYDQKTSDAVIAFNKVRRSARVGSVDAGTWRSLADPVMPKARLRRGNHIEVDQTRQVIFVVRRGRVRWILHTSTGAGGITRDGSWSVHRKLAGTSGGGLYYPSYFDGLRAIHGWSSVPTYPASHGCARVPMWSAQWIYSQTVIGTKVLVYH